MVLGLVALVAATDYPFGTPARMGPGFFPVILGAILTLLGLAITATGLRLEQDTPRARFRDAFRALRPEPGAGSVFRPLVVVMSALVAFALALPRLGLALSVALLVLISALAEPGFRPRTAVILALFLAALAVAVFRHGIGLPFRVWP